MRYIVSVSDNYIYGFGSDLSKKFIQNVPNKYGQIEEIAWQPKTVYFSLVLNDPGYRLNIFKMTSLCHEHCESCDLLPTDGRPNCRKCPSNFTLNPLNLDCEVQCPQGSFPFSDYRTCIKCPSTCSNCGFNVDIVRYPYVPNVFNLICKDTPKLVISSNKDVTEITLEFSFEPQNLALDSNIKLTSSSFWEKNEQYSIELTATPGNSLVYKLKLFYFSEEFIEKIQIKVFNIKLIDPVNSQRKIEL